MSTLRMVLLVGASILGLSPASAAEFPLKTADNGRFLIDQKGEPFLVVGDNSTPDQIRRQAYWAMLGGACGQFFGNNPMWHFDGPGLYPVETSWKEALDGTGSRDMARLRDFFTGLPWHRLEPENNHEVVTDGIGEGIATALTARTPDTRLTVTYLPSTGTESRKLTVDLTRFAGPITARWFNPADGRWKSVPDAPLPNRVLHSFVAPGDNGTQTNDWLLVLEVR